MGLKASVRHLTRNMVYTDRATIASGLKRRGDFGFIPRKLSREDQFLRRLDLRGKNVYDIGGFIGTMTVHFARAVGSAGSVTVFEPNSENVVKIRDRIAINGFENVVRVVELALGAEQSEMEFIVDRTQEARGTLEADRKSMFKGKTLSVPVDTLDHAIEYFALPKPHFVKIDVEGFESETLKGMRGTIERWKPEMQIELHGVREAEVVKFLFSYGYKIWQVEDQREILPERQDLVHGHLYVS